MQELEESRISCPYCGESLVVLLDCSGERQEYFEDCQVCCRPIHISLNPDANGATFDLVVRREDE